MTKQVSAAAAERRRTLSRFGKRQVRKNILLPEQLIRILDQGCERYDINQTEMIRMLIFAYALDVRDNGETTQFLDRMFSSSRPEDFADFIDTFPPEERDEMRARIEKAITLNPRALSPEQRARVRHQLMDQVEEIIAAVEAGTLPEETERMVEMALAEDEIAARLEEDRKEGKIDSTT